MSGYQTDSSHCLITTRVLIEGKTNLAVQCDVVSANSQSQSSDIAKEKYHYQDYIKIKKIKPSLRQYACRCYVHVNINISPSIAHPPQIIS